MTSYPDQFPDNELLDDSPKGTRNRMREAHIFQFLRNAIALSFQNNLILSQLPSQLVDIRIFSSIKKELLNVSEPILPVDGTSSDAWNPAVSMKPLEGGQELKNVSNDLREDMYT